MKDNRKYTNLNELLKNNSKAASYFSSLPGYVQSSMEDRADSINSYESLCHYADNLTKGDC